MQIIITNQALQHVYILGNQHKTKVVDEIHTLDEMFKATEDCVQEFETQIKEMQKQGEELTKKSQNTAVKEKEREQAKKELAELDKHFEAVHFSKVSIEVSESIIGMMQAILEKAIEEEKIVWRRNVQSCSSALNSIADSLANA